MLTEYEHIIHQGGGHVLQDQMVKAPLPKNFKSEDLCAKLVEGSKDDDSGSTLTIASLSKEGELEIATLGDSPAYLVVKDKNGKEVVIQLTEDMDINSSRYTECAKKLGGHIKSNRLGGYTGIQVFGAIGDKNIKGVITKPEKYNFGSGIYYNALKDFLTTELGINKDIKTLLKEGEAKIVCATDGLAKSKITKQQEHCSTAHYQIKLEGEIGLNQITDTLPEATAVSFIKVPPIKEGDPAIKVLEGDNNPVILVSNGKFDEATKVIGSLNTKDDLIIGALKPGMVEIMLDGHGDGSDNYKESTSHEAVPVVKNYITECLKKDQANVADASPPKNSSASNKSKKVFVFGENHYHYGNDKNCIYTALNKLSDAELKDFVEKNNIKYAFFEFVLADDVSLEYKTQTLLGKELSALVVKDVIDATMTQLPQYKKSNKFLQETQNALKLTDRQEYENITDFGQLIKKEGIVNAIDLISNLVKNDGLLTNQNATKIGNIATEGTVKAQKELAQKLNSLGVKVKGIESVKSFTSVSSNGAGENRLKDLNDDGGEIIAKTQTEGNGICVVGNAHLLSYDEKKILRARYIR